MVARLLRKFLLDPWRAIDREADAARATDTREYDWRPLVVLVAVCVALTLQEYIGQGAFFMEWWRRWFPEAVRTEHFREYRDLYRFTWWAGWRFTGYVIVPLFAIWTLRGERVRDYFISFKDLKKHLPVYIGLYLLILPAVIVASQTKSFSTTYPFYKWANRSSFDFWAWQGLYALQFVSLEFFFRGFMLKALRDRFGSGAIFVMVVPYCMIHYGKPMAETFGAIIAGVVLGTLAMRTRSIWGGVFIHVGVALTMDLLAVAQCPPPESGAPCPRH